MAKFIIIGAGILGATTAYQLARTGAEVTIVERNNDGRATDAAAGIVCPWLSQRRNKAWYHLAKGGARIYPHLIKQLAEDGEEETGYARVGAISIHTNEDKLIAMKQRALKRREEAPEIGDITLLDSYQTKKTFPLLADGYGSIHVSGAARVNGRALRNALLNGAKKHGATIIDGDAQLLYKGRQVTGVNVNDKPLFADTVIATNGVWMNELLKPLNITFNVTSQKAQIMHLKMAESTNTANWPVVMPPNDQYLVTFDDNRIVVGATHENDVGLDYRTTVGGINEILSKALDVFPGLAESSVLETRVGFRPFTPGFLPVIGPLPNYNGLILANGLGASGLTMGPFIGTELANLALGNKLTIDIKDYNVAGAIK
ncbi:NAD(P)/FAD-dependent oxidoreductase [Lentibacillus sp. Marseille-P4043]|uniref:NAD(P)/FAD-dependent oxidoreductase n=1 Tax=Lentibacillus sp. Marseille-P4043 TaxID=2040293 RepID=UPI000D0B5F43|nr:FAD-binding oxidoreductase [Lentibacillus sp. Marseille-P4043]